MANTIQIKRSSTAAAVPTAGQIAEGELAVNLTDKKLFTKDTTGTVVSLTTPEFSINGLTEAAPALGDFLPFTDISDSNNQKKATTEAVVKAAANASGDAPIYGCRAWVNFDGTKDTTGAASTANTNRLIRASGNVASVLRNGTGDYTITFTTALPDANYAIDCSADDSSSTDRPLIVGPINTSAPTSSSCKIVLINTGNTRRDGAYVSFKATR